MKRYFVAVAAVMALGVGAAGCSAMSDNETSICTVSDKSATRNADNTGTDYRVYTEDCGTFQVADSITRKTFRSGDTYGKIKVGETYEFTHHGYRNGFLSMFPNITEVSEVDQ